MQRSLRAYTIIKKIALWATASWAFREHISASTKRIYKLFGKYRALANTTASHY